MRRVLRSCAIACVLLLLLSPGCGKRETRVEAGDREQVFHWGNGTEVQDLDPHVVSGVSEHHIIMSLLEGLVLEDAKDAHPRPGVAESWDISPDRRVYTFHLRSAAKWSNGDPLVANDFIESYKRILTPSLGSEYSYMLYVMHNAEAYNLGKLTNFDEVGCQALDEHTLQITLDNPTPYFLALLLHSSWFPVHLPTIRKYGDPYLRGNKWTRPGRYVGNGPFVLDQWRVNDVIIVKKSPTYWDRDHVRLNAMHIYPIESEDSEERAFRAGQLHLTYQLPTVKVDYYRKNYPDLLRIDPYLGTYFYRINTTKPPLNDKRVRQALSLAMDRESIVKNVTRGGQLPAIAMTPPGTAGYVCRTKLEENVTRARQLLAAAGYPGGKGCPPIELLYNTMEMHKAIAEALQQMWQQRLGIEVRLVNQEWKVYLDAQRTMSYQMCRASWIGDYNDPNSFLDMWQTDNGNNRTGWSNKQYDALIAEAARTDDPQARLEVFQKAEAILLDELPIIPIYVYTHVIAQRPELKGWYPAILDNHPYKDVYLEPKP